MRTDLYQVLGVSNTAGPDDLKKAYRRLAKQYHPDRNKNNPKAEERFKEISRAYEVLSDPERRALFDEFGAVSLESGFDAQRARAPKASTPRGGMRPDGAFSMDDLLREMFGAHKRASAADWTQTRDSKYERARASEQSAPFQSENLVRAELSVDFRTAASGGERELHFSDGTTLKVRIPLACATARPSASRVKDRAVLIWGSC